MQSLIFFNKEGDNLNFTYNDVEDKWEGDLLFHENSDDTYKTIGLYTFEKVPAFEYENIGNLKTKKFQLFNEYRFQFSGNSNFTQSIDRIELPNIDPTFYSKWIYGEDFESKFPKGTQIRFNEPIFEFTNKSQTFTVVQTKKNAILILSSVDNATFQLTFGNQLGLSSSYSNISISGVNAIGFYNYLTPNLTENFSNWSEPNFYERFYDNRKLNIVNTERNDGIVTIKNKDTFDRVYSKYSISKLSLTQSATFSATLTLKSDTPKVYTGGLTIDTFKVGFNTTIPIVLKPGVVFTIPTSLGNTGFITIASIPQFLGNSNLKYYQVDEQVIWNNLIYQCIQGYTWSATSSIDPNNSNYWSSPRYLPTTTELIPEQLFKAEVQLATNVFSYEQSYTQSASITLNSFVEKYKNEFNFFDLDLYYEKNNLNCDLIYPTNYAILNFYSGGTFSEVGSKSLIRERSVEIKETISTELNENINSNFNYRIVITDLTDFGLKIKIDDQMCDQSIVWSYDLSTIDMEKTIDKTIRRWYEKWYLYLFTIGIELKLGFAKSSNSIYYNSIQLRTTYPNIPINFEVEVGDTGNFYIEHSEVIFKDISNYLNIIINDRSYGVNSVKESTTQTFDIKNTLSNWIDLYQETILDYGIIVTNINNTLIFRVKEQFQRLEYSIQVGKTGLPAEDLYIIKPRIFGNFGSLITSNELILPGDYIKFTPYRRQFNMNEVQFMNGPSSVPNQGDVAYLEGPTPLSTYELGFREDDVKGTNMTSWLDGMVGTELTFRNSEDQQYFATFTIDSLISSSSNFRQFGVTYVSSNGTWANIRGTDRKRILVDISYVGQFDVDTKESFSATWSFEDEDFATGQVLGINNTIYPWNNQEYNIINLDPQSMVLDYRGPFWTTAEPICEVSAYVTTGFDDGFGATGCFVFTQSVDLGGEFDKVQYDPAFTLRFGTTNSYQSKQFSITDNGNFVDVIYSDITEDIYILGDRLTIFDSINNISRQTIDLSNLQNPKKLDFNPINQFIYCLSDFGIHVVDPRLNSVYETIVPITPNIQNFEFDSYNGDVYLWFESDPSLKIWNLNNFTNSPNIQLTLSGNVIDLEYHPRDRKMYVLTDDDVLHLIDSNTKSIIETYQLTGAVKPIFYEPSESSIYIFDSTGLNKINNGVINTFGAYLPQSQNFFVYNNTLEQVVISQTNQFIVINKDGSLVTSVLTPSVGMMVINQFDGDVYLSSGQELKVLDTINGKFKWNERFGGQLIKIIYNPSINSVFGIIPTPQGIIRQGATLIELAVTLGTLINEGSTASVTITDNLYGTLDPGFQYKKDTWLKVREYIRNPRSNFIGDVQAELVWKWENDQVPELFLFDFSGDQLLTAGSFSYIGEKPLKNIRLNSKPNQDITKVTYSEYQQTIFDEVVKKMDYIDSEFQVKTEIEPIEVFLGYNSKNEGPTKSILKLYKREIIDFTITASPTNFDTLQLTTNSDGDLVIALNINSDTTFYYDNQGNFRGLKPGQILQIFVTDVTNTRNKYISNNNGIKIKIKNVFNKTLIGQKIDQDFQDEYNVIADYPKVGFTTYLSVRIKTIDTEIGSFNVYGQTEIEDIRFKVELGNTGQLVSAENVYIFKEYDINEQGLDWTILNKKRKELLMVRDEIYSFIGSYKAIINAINYFGYNDLELYEYYRNINSSSKDFGKLFKVEIPDIFDNTTPGWNQNDFIKHTLPNPSFEDTNLFNLTFNITDKEGTTQLTYTLQEVLIKLQGLKKWLQSNVIPLSHRILDITGRTDFVGITGIQHKCYDTRIIKISQSFSPYDFKLNEAYLMPVNSGSTVYTCVVDFYLSNPSESSDYFSIKIRTYQTHKEWQPFKFYNKGDKVQYFQQIYESALDNNRLRNPRKFDNVGEWSSETNYNLGDYASYYRDIYQYIGTQSSYSVYGTNSISPVMDIKTNQSFAKWLLMSEWKKVDYLPIQTLSEFRTSTQSYIFTVDSNLDPFIFIEVTSDNGYGQVFNNKKSYEIRGLKDLIDDPGRPDPMGPFDPIVFIPSVNNNNPSLSGLPTQTISIYGGLNLQIPISSDLNVLKWEIVNVNLSTGCLVEFDIIPQDLKSANLIITSDVRTLFGSFNVSIKAYVKGGNFTISDPIDGLSFVVTCPQNTTINSQPIEEFEIYVEDEVSNGSFIDSIVVESSVPIRLEIIEVNKYVSYINGIFYDQITIEPIEENPLKDFQLIKVSAGPNTSSGQISFRVKVISESLGYCEIESGTIYVNISNSVDAGSYYATTLEINCSNYSPNEFETSLNYTLDSTNISSPQNKNVTFEIVYVNNFWYLYGTPDIDPNTGLPYGISNVIISDYQLIEQNVDDSIYAQIIDENGIDGRDALYRLEWSTSGGVPLNPPSSKFDILVEFFK